MGNAIREARQDEIQTMPTEAIKYCISACNFAIVWELPQLENGSGRGTSAAQQQKQLRDHLDAYIPLMTGLVRTSPVALYREEAYLSVCDLLVQFCKQLDDNPLLRPLIYEPDRAPTDSERIHPKLRLRRGRRRRNGRAHQD